MGIMNLPSHLFLLVAFVLLGAAPVVLFWALHVLYEALTSRKDPRRGFEVKPTAGGEQTPALREKDDHHG